ncbi:NAD(P)H-dependent oxidoreductase [Actinosynnema sp. NPDC047251]|uniref:NADPH-dependent FMN reductase n=1 Tax=Saccharothrix espanaensis (strain ATCC 51144 / DSM 44229 / JCM 9112 / NBRC 15066 / NRRL 15764) TaxID=1179773 RepID=K0K2C8_SACES|nr:NAD(P)H-dependent oxidoreductase [Saccharothrix espanaensis]CCH30698.1 NADPH-dependent FMN reductase [Saccharothrix espanaensis DSM 44229]
MQPLHIAVIIGSTRQGRVGDAIGRWAAEIAGGRADVEVELVDLADYEFPASYPDQPTAAMRRFVGRVAWADGFVVVTPEYNRSFPASLKQAIDFAYDEWHAKPAAFVSYGYRSEGVYAVEQLRTVFTELHVMTMRNGVGVNLLDDEPLDSEQRRRAATTMLDQLTWWAVALRDARHAHPYVS